jgi:hypothetical protein
MFIKANCISTAVEARANSVLQSGSAMSVTVTNGQIYNVSAGQTDTGDLSLTTPHTG